MTTSIKGKQSWLNNDAGGGGGGNPSAPLNSVQYNNAGAFGGDADYTFDGTTVTFKGDTNWNKPIRTTYVRTENDFSNVTTVINGDEYFLLSEPTHFIVLDDFNLTKGVTFDGDKDFLFSSLTGGARGDYTPTITWKGFTNPANPIFLSTGSLDNFAVQSLNFIDGEGGSNYLFDIDISISNLVQWRDCRISGFDNIFNLDCRFQILNCYLTGALNELTCKVQNKCYFHNNNLLGISTANNIIINAGNSNSVMTFSRNAINNTSSNAFSIDSAISNTNKINLFDNKPSVPAQFFDPTPITKIDQKSGIVFSGRNFNVVDSSAFIDVSINDNAFALQTINTQNVPEIVTGLTMLVVGDSQRFTVANSNPGMSDNITTITYTGLETIDAELSISSKVNGQVAQSQGIGFFQQGSSLPANYYTLQSSPNRYDSHAYAISLSPGDTIKLGAINKSSSDNFSLSNSSMLIKKIN